MIDVQAYFFDYYLDEEKSLFNLQKRYHLATLIRVENKLLWSYNEYDYCRKKELDFNTPVIGWIGVNPNKHDLISHITGFAYEKRIPFSKWRLKYPRISNAFGVLGSLQILIMLYPIYVLCISIERILKKICSILL